MLSGWPRHYFTLEMIKEVQEIHTFLHQWLEDDDNLQWALQVPPATVKYAGERLSPVAFVTFCDFRLRQAFTAYYASYTAQCYDAAGTKFKNWIRTTPSMPDFQVPLEGLPQDHQ